MGTLNWSVAFLCFFSLPFVYCVCSWHCDELTITLLKASNVSFPFFKSEAIICLNFYNLWSAERATTKPCATREHSSNYLENFDFLMSFLNLLKTTEVFLDKLPSRYSLNLLLSWKQGITRCVNEVGIGFMMAPIYHPAMKVVRPVRKKLKVKTVFNILGPMLNPARVSYAVVGVYSEDLVSLFIELKS